MLYTPENPRIIKKHCGVCYYCKCTYGPPRFTFYCTRKMPYKDIDNTKAVCNLFRRSNTKKYVKYVD